MDKRSWNYKFQTFIYYLVQQTNCRMQLFRNLLGNDNPKFLVLISIFQGTAGSCLYTLRGNLKVKEVNWILIPSVRKILARPGTFYKFPWKRQWNRTSLFAKVTIFKTARSWSIYAGCIPLHIVLLITFLKIAASAEYQIQQLLTL